MYENIIGQDRVVAQLESELAAGRLPSSLLFYGPAYSGKLSTALETARVLTCENGTAEWNCQCRSCGLQRLMLHPYTLMLGPRYFGEEIAASADTLVRTGKDAARYLFIRAARKLLRRFDAFLWEGEEARLQKVEPLIRSVEDRLDELRPGSELPAEKALKKIVDAIVEECRKIASSMVSDNTPIHLIRRANYWARISVPGGRKVIVFERADRMQENSRNALLKLLEEPPAGVHLILLSERRSTVIPTILSRVRSYFFRERDAAASAEIVQKIFRGDPHQYTSLRKYFLAWKGVNPEALEAVTRRFVASLLEGGDPAGAGETAILEETSRSIGTLSDSGAFQYFLEEISDVLRTLLRGEYSEITPGRVDLDVLSAWSALIRETMHENDQLNINAALLLESLYYRMKRIGARKGKA